MPQLLSEYSAAWKLITLGVLITLYLLSELGGAGCGRQGYFSPTSFGSLVTTLNHIFPDAKELDQRTRNEVPCCPRQLYYFNPFHKLIAVHINEVMKGAVPGG